MKAQVGVLLVFAAASASAQFLGENVRSGIPSWDEAFLRAGGKFLVDNSRKIDKDETSAPIFLGENVRSGIPSWDEAFLRAGGKFDPDFETNRSNMGNKTIDNK